ncbi:MAG: tRNA (N6-isopentenyl adenosine(37)-C2)-methylthiotransferase MiaB [Defluviitaleaceae bacterium]|nr:tRNA (N6-isopentenyl adenosine(37)-C2)-methylthiotransferase MiaB [Defluviitaleaceae bacterium]
MSHVADAPQTRELDIQKEYIEKIKQYGAGKLYNLNTYGCQMNDRDSEKIAGMLGEMGYSETQNKEDADIIIFNTCCVRENAENRLYGNLGKVKVLKERNKNLKVILCGCMMQQDIVVDKIKQSYNFVDIIFGTFNIYRMPGLIFTALETGDQLVDIWKEHEEIIEDLPSRRVFKFKAGVNIMYGCNNRCSFCIVPFVRGRERSRPMSDIIEEIKNLVSDGVKEVMLLGQNVNSYGNTFRPRVSFASLLHEINKIEGLERIRFMTSHPKDLSDELIEAIATCDKVCKQLHLPVQSGSNDILKKMRRIYTREQYLELVKKIKARIPDILLTTDIIVGFPTETDEDNEDTISLMKEVEYSNAYTFIYSKREGTPAAIMEDQIPENIIKERFNKILDMMKPITLKINRKQIGKTVKVLVETVSKNDKNLLTGRLDNGLLVHFKGCESLIGEIVNVHIDDCKTFYLMGTQT